MGTVLLSCILGRGQHAKYSSDESDFVQRGGRRIWPPFATVH